MTVITGPLPYDLANLLAGGARVVISDDSTALPAIPANLKDVITLKTAYATKAGWVDVGATTEGTHYSRDMTSTGYSIEQTNADVFEDITETSRTIGVTMGEITPEHLIITEDAATITTIAAVSGAGPQKAVKFGAISDLTPRRVCFIGQRNIQSGEVDEVTGSVKRGRFVAVCLYRVTIAAEASEVTMAKGALTGLPVTFKSFPEAGQPAGQEFGTWLTEDAGAIAA